MCNSIAALNFNWVDIEIVSKPEEGIFIVGYKHDILLNSKNT